MIVESDDVETSLKLTYSIIASRPRKTGEGKGIQGSIYRVGT